VEPVARAFDPDLMLLSAGFDAHLADPLAGCRLRTSSFAQMACRVRDLAVAVDAPLGVVLEGGYNHHVLAECVVATLLALGGEGEVRSAGEPQITATAVAHLRRYWEL
jgi:acetoin utilization deacetylase AcuC-like enzyme